MPKLNLPHGDPEDYPEPVARKPIAEIYEGLDALVLAAREGLVGRWPKEWIGADVAFVDHEEERFAMHGWSPCLQVPSPHYRELGWTVTELRDLMETWLDYANKYEYYGRLGRAVNAFTQRHGRDVPMEAVVLALLHEAYALAEQFAVDGDLPAYAVTFNGEIPDDDEGLAGNLRPARAKGLRERLEEIGAAL